MYAIRRLKGIPQLRDFRQPDTLQRWIPGRSRLRHCLGLSNREPCIFCSTQSAEYPHADSTRPRLFRVLAKSKTTRQDEENLNPPDQNAMVATAETVTGKVSLAEDREPTSATVHTSPNLIDAWMRYRHKVWSRGHTPALLFRLLKS